MLTISQLFAMKLKGVNCKFTIDDINNLNKISQNEWFNGGCQKASDSSTVCWTNYSNRGSGQKTLDAYLGHCRQASADTVFMFLTAVVMLVCGLMVWLRMKKGY
jgi:hypothetical protein